MTGLDFGAGFAAGLRTGALDLDFGRATALGAGLRAAGFFTAAFFAGFTAVGFFFAAGLAAGLRLLVAISVTIVPRRSRVIA